jgi:hypothetical protein
MYSVDVTYLSNEILTDEYNLELDDKDLSSFLNMLNKKYARLYSVEYNKHTVFAFTRDTVKVVIKVYH